MTRQVTANYIYLIWRRNPDFGFDVLTELEELISIRSVTLLPTAAETLLRVVFEISLNYVHDGQVIGNLSLMVHKLAEKLWLTHDASKSFGGAIAKTIRDLLFPVATKVMASQVITQMLLGGFIPIDKFMASSEERARMRNVITKVGKNIQAKEAIGEILKMVSSGLIYPNSVMAGLITSLLATEPENAIPLVQEMFDSNQDTISRLSILVGCMVLIPSSRLNPPVFLGFLEQLTRRFVDENKDFPTGGFWGSLRALFSPLTPLSLVYYTLLGEKTSPCPIILELLTRAKTQQDTELFNRCIDGVKATGLYYPTAALEILEKAVELGDEKTLPAIEAALKIIKTLFPTEVDRFLIRVGASDEFKRHVETGAVDIEQVGVYVSFVGLYRTYTYLLSQPNTTDFMRNQIALTTECTSVQEMAEKCMKAMWETLEDLDFSLAKLLGHS